MWRTVSGFSTFIPSDFSADRFGRTMRSVIRSIWRHRDNLIQLATVHLQHMQKALDQMNIQIHHVISDLAGTTGLAIVDAILAGERDLHKLARLRDWRIRASEEAIMKSLAGDYRDEHLFTLRQSLKSYRHYQ